ncbi:TetR/AcrR family transcriptional regulator [Sphaerisporangium sp. NPDC051017]|uniref:TetR/AcrR family transcriptional regulator n=1 Tax=Sphaerisporangium sp. NPDC051017 TaxID=3154636 RepID=UPI00343F3EA0
MTRTRHSPKGERMREAILDAAAELFSTRGYRGTSVDAIAEAAELSKAGLLHHFANKETLLFAVVRERVGMDGAEMAELSRTDVGFDNLERYVRLIERRFSDPGWVRLYTVLLAESLDISHPINDYMRSRVMRLRRVVSRALDAGIREGRVAADVDKDEIAATIVGAVDGLRIQLLLAPSFDAARAFRRLVDSLLEPVLQPQPQLKS